MNRLTFLDAGATIRRRVPLLLLVAAVIAGIFGMHVVSGSHARHSNSTAGAVFHHEHGPAQHLQTSSPADAEQCTSGSCSCAQTGNANCTPSHKTGSLAAPPPGDAVVVTATATAPRDPSPSWSYRPAAPTPRQLSISRT
ncbi:DUF6153 family protein [Paenarthrobacter sp. JL.01a]|uniref:DUF6153 family protein n=1 Tax=Paenarthrobacter sp. JL.01a TaxID=2979324 RepID=UPI0021C84E40|nr:DUF6153 family protein [Paenarthrobacter sp. JL.01a]UXM90703.1 DUF6153 family protein [Paenarthrobacter sp. JL.01a]